MVRESFKKKMGKTLLEMKEELLKDILQGVKHEKDSSKQDIGDIYDIASSERERELSLILNDRERTKLKEIEDALERIAVGSYGICEECEEYIDVGRLKILPFTKVCVDCKSKDERAKGTLKIYDKYNEVPPKVDLSEFKEEE